MTAVNVGRRFSRPTLTAVNEGACVAATNKLTAIDGRQTKKHCNDGTYVTATDNDCRQTRLFLVESGHVLLIYFVL